MNETITWEFTDMSPQEQPNTDDIYHYATDFYGVDYYMDVYVTNGEITDHICSRYMDEPLGYLYEQDFDVPQCIVDDVDQRIKQPEVTV